MVSEYIKKGKCLVTGGAGFIGSHVVKVLLSRGYTVRVLIQEDENTNRLKDLDIEIIRGNLLDYPSLMQALDSCEYLFHLAALHALWLPDYKIMYDVNVLGTKNILQAAKEKNIRKCVYTSTQNIIGTNKNGLSKESTPFLDYNKSSHYTKSKYQAEQEAFKAYEQGLSVVIVNPSGPFGEGDFGPTGQLILNFLKGKTPFYFDAYFNAIDVKDLALGHVLALENGKAGERYILSNVDISLKDFFSLLEKLSGIRAPSLKLPLFFAYPFAFILEQTSNLLTHTPPKLSLDRVRQRKIPKKLDNTKVKKLGLHFTPLEDTLERIIRWYKENGEAYPRNPQEHT